LKKWMMLAAILALVLVAAAPVVAQVGFGIGDTENESGEIGTENNFAIEGNNNSACLGELQSGQTGSFTNQQGTLQDTAEVDDNGFAGGGIGFAPENATECAQEVQQAASASSAK